ncbi:hypothetical protein HZA98_01000 [Candidatus Woesearchaeota archaeon]|nr:hypothetical protein [Candidatus Woesearchaeota archaeon]
MEDKNQEEYNLLVDILDRTTWALDGSCDDIDCDQYMYKESLRKKCKPVLEHPFSCVEKLKIEKEAVLRILSQRKYTKYRYKKCNVCKKGVDSLSKDSDLMGYTRPSQLHKNSHEWNSVWVHKRCRTKVKTPKGWKKL